MTEEFLHYLWKYQNFNRNFKTTSRGQKLKVIHPGFHNHDSGPDFLEAKIYLDNQLWVGQVELHLKSSDWYQHKHQNDPIYQNVILHVVYEDDQPVYLNAGEEVPCLVLQGCFDEYLYWRFEQLMQNRESIPCASSFKGVDAIVKSSMIDRLIAERLEVKSLALESILKETSGDWQESFYRFLAYGLGLKVNADPMNILSRACPSKLWRSFRSQTLMMEALFFGQAGLLNEQDSYSNELAKQYKFLQRKHGLSPMESKVWKYSRMRPGAFPDFRLSQLVALLQKHEFLATAVLEVREEKELKQLFTLEEKEYWQQHYRLGRRSASVHKSAIGNQAYRMLIINVVVPYMFLYAKKKALPELQLRALGFLQALPSEENKITRIFQALGTKSNSALESQALLQWYKFYCARKKCLNCSVGIRLIKS